MKYGIIQYNYGDATQKNFSNYNIGDPIQGIAVYEFYKSIGILDSEIRYIPLCDLSVYCSDEYVLLPIIGVAAGIQFGVFPFPERIIPLFISTHIAKNELNSTEIEYLRQYAPIGCRDEYSLNVMRKYRIPAYLSGCITVLFPKRTTTHKQTHVFLVDIPNSLKEFIPKSILANSEEISHMFPLPEKEMTNDDAAKYYHQANQLLQRYNENASLVVSSRMHALVPCMAMGIPVIGVFENISYRFSWLDKYIKLYSSQDFDQIDWNPAPVEYEEQKARIQRLFAEELTARFEEYSRYYSLSEFYENRQRANYGNYYSDKIKSISSHRTGNFDYIIWGCGLAGTVVYELMKSEYPQSRLICACDSYVTGKWKGVNIIKPEELKNYKNALVLLATYSGKKAGYQLFSKLNYKENIDFIYVGTKNG